MRFAADHRRIINVPKDKEAQEALDYDTATEDQLIEWRPNAKEYEVLWLLTEEGTGSGFKTINRIYKESKRTSLFIGDGENSWIEEKECLQKSLDALNKIKTKTKFEEETLDKLKVLFQEAIDRDTGIYFFF